MPDVPPAMTPVDAAWLHIERDANPMTITAVLWFDAPVDAARLSDVLQERLVDRFPRFTWRPESHPLTTPRWVPHAGFSLDAHLGRIRLEGAADHAALAELIGGWMSGPLPRSMPPWRLDLVEGLQTATGEGAALVARVHHSVADGISLARVLLSLADGDRARPLPVHPPRTRWQEEARGLSRVLELGFDAARELRRLIAMPPDPYTPLREPLSGTRRCAWSAPLSLEVVKGIGRATGTTVNDVLVSVWAGALGAHLRDRGHGVDALRAFLPVNLRPLDEPVHADLGNGFSLVIPSLAVGIVDPVARLRAVHTEMTRLKEGTEPAVAWALLQVLGASPRGLENMIVDVFAKKASVLLTNVPGPRQPLSLAGTEVAGVQVFVPQTGNIGLGLSIFSYAGEVTVGVSADVALVPEPRALIRGFEETFGELAVAVGVQGRRGSAGLL